MRYVLAKTVTGFSLAENKVTRLPAESTVELPLPPPNSRGIAYLSRDGQSVAEFLDDIQSRGKLAHPRELPESPCPTG